MSDKPTKQSKGKCDFCSCRGDDNSPWEYSPGNDNSPHEPPPQSSPPVPSDSTITSTHTLKSGYEPPQPWSCKRDFIYTIDQLKSRRHDRELSTPALFQYYAELQLYRQFLNVPVARRSKPPSVQADMHVLQHRINSICLQLNRFTFSQVFQEIVHLGITSDVFILSFVNVVFKQAVLNPPLALLFSMLSCNVSHVLKGTSYADQMKRLFLERCEESFLVPCSDTDKGMIILLRGIVCFAGHLLRDSMLPSKLLHQWADGLLESGSTISIELLISFLLACGSPLIRDNPDILERLSNRMKSIVEPDLAESWLSLQEIIHGTVPPAEQISREFEKPELHRSPSIDKELNGKYPSLFKRSGSIPLELSQMSDLDGEHDTMSSIVTQYFYNPDLQDFILELSRIGYSQNDSQIPIDLVRAVIEKPTANQMVVSALIFDLLRAGYYDDDQLLSAIPFIAQEIIGPNPDPSVTSDPNVISKGSKLVRIYAEMLNQDVANFDQFETLFNPMRCIWPIILQQFFLRLDQLRGDWIYDLLESPFWREVKFLGVDSIFDKFEKLKDWNLMSYLPQYEVASLFAESSLAEVPDPVVLSTDDLPIVADIVPDIIPLVFEVLMSLNEEKMIKAAKVVKKWMGKSISVVPQLAQKYGQLGEKVATALQ